MKNHGECMTKLIKLDLKLLRSSLYDYNNVYVLAKRTITAINTTVQDQPNNGANGKVIFKNCAPFTKCISR